MSVAFSVDQDVTGYYWAPTVLPPPPGYACYGAALQSQPGGGRTAFFSLAQQALTPVPVTPPVCPLGMPAHLDAPDFSPLPTRLALELQRLARGAAGLDIEMATSDRSDASVTTRPPSPIWELASAVCAEPCGEPPPPLLDPATLLTGEAQALARVLAQCEAEPMKCGSPEAISTYLARVIRQNQLEDPVFVYDLGLPSETVQHMGCCHATHQAILCCQMQWQSGDAGNACRPWCRV